METSNWSLIPSFHPTSWGGTTLLEWLHNLCGSSQQSSTQVKGARSLAILVCWTIWKERNAMVFQGIERQASDMMMGIKSEAMLWTQAGNKNLTRLVDNSVSE
jgi:hypothetical protein